MPRTIRPARRYAVAALCVISCAGAAAAQAPTATRPPSPPARPLAPKLDGTKVKPGNWVYATTVAINGQSQDLGTRTIAVTAASYQGVPAWLIVDSNSGGATGAEATDSVYARRADLSGLHRRMGLSSPMGTMQLATEMTKDSVTGAVSGSLGTASIHVANRPGLIQANAILDVGLATIPLKIGTHSTFDLLAVGPQGTAIVPVELEVIGDERVTVPAGSFDVWAAVVRSSQATQRLWIAKEGQHVVKLQMSPPQAPTASVEAVLTSATPK